MGEARESLSIIARLFADATSADARFPAVPVAKTHQPQSADGNQEHSGDKSEPVRGTLRDTQRREGQQAGKPGDVVAIKVAISVEVPVEIAYNQARCAAPSPVSRQPCGRSFMPRIEVPGW